MNTEKTLRIASWTGIVVSLALAGVTYRINTGGSPGSGHGPTWCVFGFGVLEYAAWQYLLFCIRGCPGPGAEGQSGCVGRCMVRFIILQLILIVLLLSCLLATGPRW